MEGGDDPSRLNEQRHATLDRGNCHVLGLGQIVPADGHEPSDSPGGRSVTEGAFRLLRPSAARCPFGDDVQAAPEAQLPELPPQRGAITPSGRPLLVQPRQVGFQRTLTGTKDIGPQTPARCCRPASGYGRSGGRSP